MPAPPVELDFLQQIIRVNWGSAGYIVVKVTAASNNPRGPVPPAAPVIELTLGAKESVADQSYRENTSIVPPSDSVIKHFFIWCDVAPFPTLANYTNIVATLGGSPPSIGYAAQFSEFLMVNTSQFYPPIFAGQDVSGFYTSLGAANTAALAEMAHYYTGQPPSSTMSYFHSDGSGLNTPDLGPGAPPLQPLYGAELDQPVHNPGSATTTAVKTYLIKVPVDLETIRLNVSSSAVSSLVQVYGYHGPTPKSLANVNPTAYDTFASASASFGTYTITSKIMAEFTTVTCVGPSGGGGSGGTGGG
jgi:hypothetical protein